MTLKLSTGKRAVLLIVLILIADQVLKVWIKTHMTLGQTFYILGTWFQIRFIENPGMAFGIDIPGDLGKPALTIFRLIASVIIAWYLNKLLKENVPSGLIYCIALIFAGAVGNIIDCACYGLIFSESTYLTPAVAFPDGGGYAKFLYGKVVDMLYFPVIESRYPGWFPVVGGREFVFFRPIFNIADTSISTGVIAILVFQKRFFKHQQQQPRGAE